MQKRRLTEIAGELGRPSKELLEELRGAGIVLKSALAMVDEETEAKIRGFLAGAAHTYATADAASAPRPAGPAPAAGTILRTASAPKPAPPASPSAPSRSVYTPTTEKLPVSRLHAEPVRTVAAAPAGPSLAEAATPAASAAAPPAPAAPAKPGAATRRRFEPDEPARPSPAGVSPAAPRTEAERRLFLPDAPPEAVPSRAAFPEKPKSTLAPLPPLPPMTPRAPSPSSFPGARPAAPSGAALGRPGAPAIPGRRPGAPPGAAPRPHRLAPRVRATKAERRVRREAEARAIEARAAETAASDPSASSEPAVAAKPVLKISELTTIAELADKLAVKTSDLIKKCLDLGVMVTINQRLDQELASMLVAEYGFDPEFVPLYGEEMIAEAPDARDAPETLKPRPPIVTVMGHVDHGKTTLLDAIRETRVTETEHGGITQHIGAYRVEVTHEGRPSEAVFLDTPGHEAFTAMRARGAKVTDLVVLVVAADDGVQPQTLEAVSHAKAASVPILVAVNKMDKPEANPMRIKQELAEHGLSPEEWGGKTIYCEVSAKKREGLPHLLEMILLQADLLELKANPDKPASGVVIEARMDRGRGPVATVLVQAGTLRVGDNCVCGMHYGKIRALVSDRGEKLASAGPAIPVEVQGLSGVPEPGDNFQTVTQERLARHISQRRQEIQRERAQVARKPVTLDNFMDQVKEGQVKELKLIVKADVHGSAEALRETLERLPSAQVRAQVIHSGIGNVSESDVLLASASNAVILGFNVKVDVKAADLAERTRVDVRSYNIIYQVVDSVRAAMEGLLEPEWRTNLVGRVEVRNTFKTPGGVIAGCYVTSGKIPRGADCRVLRGKEQVYAGKIASLRRFKDDVKEVGEGFECGIGFDRWDAVAIGDQVEVTVQERVAARLKTEA